MKYPRNILETILEALKTSPAVLLIGARQTGKTTLVQEIHHKYQYNYVSFDDLFAQSAADADPVGFVEQLNKPIILDEVQSAPQIFLPIKRDIDMHRNPGRYLLTGSANPLVVPKLGDSLAGRLQIIQMWPLSQGELHGRHDSFIDTAFAEHMHCPTFENFNKEKLLQLVIKGGYPAMQHLESEKAHYNFCNSYLTTLIQKDMTDLAKIENLRSIPTILQILATRAGALLNERDVARAAEIPLSTLHRYLQLLQHLFLVTLLPGWYVNLGKRIVKAPKIYFVDTAILLHLLGFNHTRLLSQPRMLGHIIENFVVTEILKQITWSEIIVKAYHFRTHDGADEVDLVLESTSGKIIGIEIKASETVTKDDFKGLKKLQQTTGDQFLRGIVLYIGSTQLPFGTDLIAAPISMLWTS